MVDPFPGPFASMCPCLQTEGMHAHQTPPAQSKDDYIMRLDAVLPCVFPDPPVIPSWDGLSVQLNRMPNAL